MTKPAMKRLSLGEIKQMRRRGELFHDPRSPEGEDLGAEFWAKANVERPRTPRSVHLKIDADVFDFFKKHGKGHLTRMQDVLKAYVNAHRS
jgi:uncharacterized protein (DUF4415 family)